MLCEWRLWLGSVAAESPGGAMEWGGRCGQDTREDEESWGSGCREAKVTQPARGMDRAARAPQLLAGVS